MVIGTFRKSFLHSAPKIIGNKKADHKNKVSQIIAKILERKSI